MFAAFLTTLLFAVSAVSANRSTRLLGSIEANFWRITLATVLLAFWAHTAGSGFAGAAFPWFLLSGCVGFGLGDLAYYQALPRLGTRLAIMLVHCLAAPFAALVEWGWLGTTLTATQLMSSVTILIGVAIALAPAGHRTGLSKRILVPGILFGLLAALGQGTGAVLSRKAYQVASEAGQHIDGLSAAYQRIVAGWVVGAIAFALLRNERRLPPIGRSDAPDTQPQRAWPWVMLNALAGPALGVGCFQWALATQPTGVVLPIISTTPIVVMPLAVAMEGERPRLRSLAGGAVAVAGAVVLSGGGKVLVGWLFGGSAGAR
jgi:drug/metabolite transporter (DMT)-like permease